MQDARIAPDQTAQHQVDKLTLELFMNKQQYRKFIAKTDPQKHAENEERIKELTKYSVDILSMTQQFLENPDLCITTEVRDVFDKYTQTLIRHFKMKEVERANLYNFSGEDDDGDSLFGKIVAPTSTRSSAWSHERVSKRY